ncbi:glycerate kinase [Lactobacillus terrae]|uniref:glycerate kinase n=1 Tax=Lactobacillus terrae TaxID=2269374 RepID=UPI000C1B77EC|nr:glycerate kinase [Lactobacillus terrae]
MKILIAIDSMKGSMTSIESNQIIKDVFENNKTSVANFAIADGGEGTVEAFAQNLHVEIVSVDCHDLKGDKISASYSWIPDQKLAVIESSATSGIQFLDNTEQTHPRMTNSYGLGEQILTAVNHGADKIIIGLGGTGTVDAGLGMMSALGVRFYDDNYSELDPIPKNLGSISKLDSSGIDNNLKNVEFILAADVKSPITGTTGAVYMFGKQKGITDLELSEYEKDMEKFSKLLLNSEESQPGDGAAGGLGMALRVMLNADIEPGLILLAKYTHLEEQIEQSDLIITGEGKMDNQSLQGKVPVSIAAYAKKHGVPVIAFVGSFQGDREQFRQSGINAIVPIVKDISTLEEAIKNVKSNLRNAAQMTFDLLNI